MLLFMGGKRDVCTAVSAEACIWMYYLWMGTQKTKTSVASDAGDRGCRSVVRSGRETAISCTPFWSFSACAQKSLGPPYPQKPAWFECSPYRQGKRRQSFLNLLTCKKDGSSVMGSMKPVGFGVRGTWILIPVVASLWPLASHVTSLRLSFLFWKMYL